MLSLTTTIARNAVRSIAIINGKPVVVEWMQRADRALRARDTPLIMELELYFSCLVKKFVHFRSDVGHHVPAHVTDKLVTYFRPVTSTACSWDEARQRDRQPEIEIDVPVVQRLAPKHVFIDYRMDAWQDEYEFCVLDSAMRTTSNSASTSCNCVSPIKLP